MKSVFVHGGLAVLGLVLAYWTWNRPVESERAPEEQILVECSPDEFQGFSYTTTDRRMKLEKRTEGESSYFWVTSWRAAAEGAPEKNEGFVADSVRLKEWLKTYAPLYAVRSLGAVSQDQLKEFKLNDNKTTLTYTCRGRTRTFNLGDVLPGESHTYSQESGRGPVLLLPGGFTKAVQGSQYRFMLRSLHTFDPADVEAVVIRDPEGRTGRILQRKRGANEESEWVDANAADRRNELFGNYMERVNRLEIDTFLAPGEDPGVDFKSPDIVQRPIVHLEFEGRGGEKLGFMDYVRVDKQTDTHFYARSESTRNWIVIGQTGSSVPVTIQDDLPAVLQALNAQGRAPRGR